MLRGVRMGVGIGLLLGVAQSVRSSDREESQNHERGGDPDASTQLFHRQTIS